MKIVAYSIAAVAVVLIVTSLILQIAAAATHTSGMTGSLTSPATALALTALPLAGFAFVLKHRAAVRSAKDANPTPEGPYRTSS